MIRVTNSEIGSLQGQAEIPKPLQEDSPENKIPSRTTPVSPKSIQTLSMLSKDSKEETTKRSISSQSSINSGSLSHSSSDLGPNHDSSRELSTSYLNQLSNRAKTILEEDQIDNPNTREVFQSIHEALRKVRSESNNYRIRAELLSISSKDADMRYEVENELIKREVERLKNKGSNMDYLMNKINHQKQTLKKYKNEIIEKNKEIIQLRSIIQNNRTKNFSIRPITAKSEDHRLDDLASTEAEAFAKKRKTLGRKNDL